MEILSQHKILHGDLAARNVLLGSQLVPKIADFGLANKLDQSGVNFLMNNFLRLFLKAKPFYK